MAHFFLPMIELLLFSFLGMHRMGFNNYQSMNMVHKTKQGSELWLGDYYAASNLTLLKQKNIRSVLTSAAMLGISYPKESAITHKTINAFDIPSYRMTPHFDEAFRFIDDALKQGNILVHCAAGISRSTTFVLVFLMRGERMAFKQAIDYVRSKRSIICPNYGFQNQLKRLQIQLKKEKEDDQRVSNVIWEKKAVIDFLNEDKKTVNNSSNRWEDKFSSTFGGSRPIITPTNSTNLAITFNDSSLRGKSMNYQRRSMLPAQQQQRGTSKQPNLTFKLQVPKIVTIRK